MKTVRTSAFETNSSSTHSITFVNKRKKHSSFNSKEILIDGVFHPVNLEEHEPVKTHRGILASTRLEKSALMVNYILNALDYNSYCHESDYEKNRGWFDYLVQKLIEINPEVESVVIDYEDYGMCNSVEDESYCDVTVIESDDDDITTKIVTEDNIKIIDQFIKDYVMDERIQIIDEDIPY